jgi:hypothetical protein
MTTSVAVECAILGMQVNQYGLNLNGNLELLVYAADVNILGGSVYTVKKNTEALVFASKETVEVIADNTKYMVMSQDQNARQSQSIKIDNNSFERVEEFKYLGATLTNQNSLFCSCLYRAAPNAFTFISSQSQSDQHSTTNYSRTQSSDRSTQHH